MTPEQAKTLISLLGGKVSSVSKKQVGCHCIFAPWKHERGVDKHPSGVMHISEAKLPKYHCYSCSSQGTPDQIYHEIKHLNSVRPRIKIKKKKILKFLDGVPVTDDDFKLPNYDDEMNKKPFKLHKFSENWWARFPTAYYHPYTVKRGIDPVTASNIDIKVDFLTGRILFPVRDWEGVLMGVHGRSYIGSDLRYYAYPRNGKQSGERNPSVWMGENHVDLDQPVILTEGQFDYAKVLQHYRNVLSGLTTKYSEYKMGRIQHAEEIITIFDNGKGGDEGRKRISQYFPPSKITHWKVPSTYGDLGDCPEEVVYDLLDSIP